MSPFFADARNAPNPLVSQHGRLGYTTGPAAVRRIAMWDDDQEDSQLAEHKNDHAGDSDQDEDYRPSSDEQQDTEQDNENETETDTVWSADQLQGDDDEKLLLSYATHLGSVQWITSTSSAALPGSGPAHAAPAAANNAAEWHEHDVVLEVEYDELPGVNSTVTATVRRDAAQPNPTAASPTSAPVPGPAASHDHAPASANDAPNDGSPARHL